MDKYHERSNERRAELQNKQLDQQRELDSRLDVKRQREEADLQNYYGPSKKSLKQNIATLNTRLNEPGLKGFLFRARNGKAAQLELENSERSLKNLQWRMSERRQIVANDEQTQREQLKHRQHIERENLERQIANPGKAPTNKSETQARKTNPHTEIIRPARKMSRGRAR